MTKLLLFIYLENLELFLFCSDWFVIYVKHMFLFYIKLFFFFFFFFKKYSLV